MIRVSEIEGVLALSCSRNLPRAYRTGAFLVDGLLVDSGIPRTAAEMARLAAERGVKQVVNTHHHEDHIGGNAAVARRTGARILAHPLALERLRDWSGVRPFLPYRTFMFGRPEASHGEPLAQALETPRHRFEVHHVPGHTPDHVALFERARGWLFCGDAFVGGEDRASRPKVEIRQVIASLAKLRALEPRVLFAGSGSVYPNAKAALDRKLAYLEDLGGRVLGLHERGVGEEEIARRLLGRDGWFSLFTSGDYRGVHLVRSYLRARRPGVIDSAVTLPGCR